MHLKMERGPSAAVFELVLLMSMVVHWFMSEKLLSYMQHSMSKALTVSKSQIL